MAPGLPGPRQVLVQVEQNGFSRAAMSVAAFTAPVATAPRSVHALVIVRRGTTVTARWSRVAGASHYAVDVLTSGGLHVIRTQTTTLVSVPMVLPSSAVTVRVVALDGFDQASPPALRTLAGGGLSACLAPRKLTIRLTGATVTRLVARLNGHVVAGLAHGGRRVTVDLAGIPGRRITLSVRALTNRYRKLTATYTFHLCAGKRIPASLALHLI